MNFYGDGGGDVVSDDDHHRHQYRHDHRTHRRVEIITGTERRRTWPVEVKARIIAESLKPGANVSALAREHGVAVGLLHNLRRAERARRDNHQPIEFVPLVAAVALPHHQCDFGDVVASRKMLPGTYIFEATIP